MDGKARLHERLEDALRRERMSLRELARAVGVSHSTLSNIRGERGTPSPEVLHKLAPYLRESVDTLLVWVGHKRGSPEPAAHAGVPDIWLRADPNATREEIEEVLPIVEATARAAIAQARARRRERHGDDE